MAHCAEEIGQRQRLGGKLSEIHRLPERRLMRIVAFILSILLTTGLLLGGIVLLVLTGPPEGGVSLLLSALGLSFLVCGPLTVGSFRAYWDVEGSAASRTYYRRLLVVVGGVSVLGAALVIVGTAVGGGGPLVPVLCIAGSVVLFAAAVLIGRALYRYDRKHPRPTTEWVAIEPAAIRKRVVVAALTFVGVMIIGIISLALLNGAVEGKLDLVVVVLYPVTFASLAAGLVCLLSTLGWSRRIRDVTDRDPARLRRVAQVVLRGKKHALDEHDQIAAAKYAAIVSVTMPFQTTYFLLLYVGVLMQQGFLWSHGDDHSVALFLLPLYVVLLVVFIPLQIVRSRRARRYARAHAVVLEALRA